MGHDIAPDPDPPELDVITSYLLDAYSVIARARPYADHAILRISLREIRDYCDTYPLPEALDIQTFADLMMSLDDLFISLEMERMPRQ